MRIRRRAGFTLVELLVVIAIIGVLVALLLPAIQAAREAGRRMSCGNNLHQVGIALHNYHDVLGSFPPEAIWLKYYSNQAGKKGYPAQAPQAATYPNGDQRNFTWISLLLPYFEQKTLADKINYGLPIYGQLLPDGTPVVESQIKTLLCPSDDPFDDLPHGIAVTSYAGAEGWDWWPRGGSWYAGVFTLKHGTTLAEIKDGTANTVAVAEVSQMSYTCCKPGVITSVWPTWVAYGGAGRIRQGNERVARAALVAANAEGGSVAPCTGICSGLPVHGPLYFATGNGATVNIGNWNGWAAPYLYKPTYVSHYNINTEWPGAGSGHSGGGVQVCMADGSVRFISEKIVNGNTSQTNAGWNGEGRGDMLWTALNSVRGPADQNPGPIP
jgi:prepilin-type N-terminal cleavage/methylation domain-containing protein/prepilin-type processing-associated H-X9-DG protein